jgi:serine/threonine-protein kinase
VIATGGMAVVLRACDPALNRDLAVKVLRADLRERPELVRRFVEEAQITAQLPHPGIVPVHELGHDDNGLPFLAMKLVRGETLADLLGRRASPQEALPQLVGIFEQVCQAVAFAHSRHVIHRDLKPANIMVGRFGEVQVMDWGLAKCVGDAPTPEETAAGEARASMIRTLRSEAAAGPLGSPTGTGSGTEAGTVLGTPAYMPPEQAAGLVHLLDERCDVFGLGAILCEVLTGKPPFVARESWRVVCMAALGELADAFGRLESCGAETELVALAQECLRADLTQRPRDAGVVAQRVAAYQRGVQERLRAAEIDRAAAQARAVEERKRRRLALALMLVVFLAVLGGLGGWLWYERDRAQRTIEAARRETEELIRENEVQREASHAYEQAVAFRKKGDHAEAMAELSKAAGLLTGGSPELQAQREPLRLRVRAMGKDLEMLAKLSAIRLRMADAMVDSEFDPLSTTPLFLAAFHEYGIEVGALEVAEAARRVSESAIRAELVEALEDWAADLTSRIPRTVAHELARLEQVPADTLDRQLLHAIAPKRQKVLQIAEAAGPPPDALLRRVRETVARLDHKALSRLAGDEATAALPAMTQFRLAINLYVSGGAPHEVIAVLRRAERQYPADFWINHELGYQLMDTVPPQAQEALRYYSVALALRPKSPGAHHNVARALQEMGRLEEAIAEFRIAIALQPNYAYAHNSLGNCLIAIHQVEEGLKHLRKATEIAPEYAGAYMNLGLALDTAGRSDEAIEVYREGVRHNDGSAPLYSALGKLLLQRDRTEEAVASLRLAARLAPNDAESRNALTVALLAQRKYAEALAASEETLRLQPQLVPAHTNHGLALAGLHRWSEAVDACRKAVTIDPGFARGHYRLGSVLLRAGRTTEAVAALEEALRLSPYDADPYPPLALSLLLQGRLSPAWEMWRTGTDAKRLALAESCLTQHRNAMAARCYRDVFQAQPAWAAAPSTTARYNAACAAALAGTGQGKDVEGLNERERSAWRQQALEWLRADLAQKAKLLEIARPEDRMNIVAAIQQWQRDPDLAGVRDAAGVAQLPEGEQQAWRQLWTDVAGLLNRAGATHATSHP